VSEGDLSKLLFWNRKEVHAYFVQYKKFCKVDCKFYLLRDIIADVRMDDVKWQTVIWMFCLK
jgi:hypothetical protein